MNFKVTGMHCEKCEERLVKMLSKVPGVSGVKASSAAGTVDVTGSNLDREQLATVIEDTGFDVSR